MSRQQLLDNRKQLEQLHKNNPNYVSRPPIGEAKSSYYSAKESQDMDLKWKPSVKNIQVRKAEEYVFKPSCKLVEEPWARQSHYVPKVKTERKEYEISAQYKQANDRKAFLGRGRRDHKQWHSTVFLPGTTTKALAKQPSSSELKDLLQYKFARPYRDDMNDRIRFRDHKRKQ